MPINNNSFTKEDRKYIAYEIEKAKKAKVEVFFSKRKWVRANDSNKVNGYFDDCFEKSSKTYPRLAMANLDDTSSWLGLLAHESSHMDQWIEAVDCWNYSDPNDPELFDRALTSGKVDPIAFKHCIDKLILLEADCEIRALNKINNFNISIDPKVYAQKANAYIYFYHYIYQYKKWYSIGQEPYNTPSIVSQMPTTLHAKASDYLKITADIMGLYECVYNKPSKTKTFKR